MNYPIWEKQEGETDKAYAGFRIYRDLGNRRSLRAACAVYRAELEQANEPDKEKAKGIVLDAILYKKPGKISGHFSSWCSQFSWVERAAAYDAYRDSLVRPELEREYIAAMQELRKRQVEWSEQAWRQSVSFLSFAMDKMSEVPPEELSHADISRYARLAVEFADSSLNAAKDGLAIEPLLAKLKESMKGDNGEEGR